VQITSQMGHNRTHAPQQRDHYSITSSANNCRELGTVRPSAPAIFRLMTSSNLVGSSTGRSPGLVPRRMRSTYDAGKSFSASRTNRDQRISLGVRSLSSRRLRRLLGSSSKFIGSQ
jgi:hypothetical protein